MPAGDDERDAASSGIVHGDYRLDNLLAVAGRRASPSRPSSTGRWPRSATRSPTSRCSLVYDQLGTGCAAGAPSPTRRPRPATPTATPSSTRYRAASGRDLPDLGFHLGLAYLKIAVILEGIHHRFLAGQTVGEGFDTIGEAVEPLLAAGLEATAWSDLSLTDEQQAFRDLARDFLDREAVPHRTQWDRDESVDLAIVPKMAEIGFFGLTIPEEYGGLGGDYVTYALGMEELGRADSALRGIVSVSSGLVGKSILFHGTEEQKQEWLPRLATAEALGCFGLTEPDTGSDAGNLTSRAVHDGDDYADHRPEALHHQRHLGRRRARLRPHRRRGPARHLRRSSCPPTPPASRPARSRASSGCAARPPPSSCLDDVRVPASAMLGGPDGEGQGFKVAMSIARQGPARRWPPAASASCRAAWRPRSTTPPPAPSSAARSPASSWCRT